MCLLYEKGGVFKVRGEEISKNISMNVRINMYIDVGLLADVLGGGGCVGDYSTFSDRRLVLLALVSTLVSTLALALALSYSQSNIALSYPLYDTNNRA